MRIIYPALLLFLGGLLELALAVGTAPNLDLEKRMFELVNRDRVMKGLPALRYDSGLAAVARAHSQDMVTRGYFAHHSSRTGDHADRIQRAGISWSRCGENLALDQSVESAQKHLMESPGHRANILSRDYTHIGIGIVRSGGRIYATQNFIRPRSGGGLASIGGSRGGRRRGNGIGGGLSSLLWNAISND